MKKIYVLEFFGNQFIHKQSISGRMSMMVASITSDPCIVFGDQSAAGENIVQIYSLGNSNLFESSHTFEVSNIPLFASLSPKKNFLAISTSGFTSLI